MNASFRIVVTLKCVLFNVFFITGFGIDHHYFEESMETIFAHNERDYKRYYIDLPGMGLSKPGKVKSGDDIVELIIHFIQEIVEEESVLLVGNSFGGLLCCGLANQIPEHIEGMILIAPSTARKERKLPEMKVWKKDEALLKRLTKEQRENFCAFNVNLTEECWKVYERNLYPAIIQCNQSDYLNNVLEGNLSYDHYKAFEKPVLVITGKQDVCVGYEDAYELIRHFPAATYVALQGVGHNVDIDQPGMFKQIVIEWLKSQLDNE